MSGAQESITKAIIKQGQLKVAIPNIQSMSHEDYALARKNYFGASDSSILCGVNLYKTLDQLIVEKNSKFLTKEEKEVGDKPIVKKGYDLEPIILNKAEIELNLNIFKPADMYAFIDTDGLSVNYDGVAYIEDTLIPIEAKLVSRYGEKYYNKSKTIEEVSNVSTNTPEWFKNGVELALLAPTAMNQQKFKIVYNNDTVTLKAGIGMYTKLDLGIIKYHFEIGANRKI